MPIPWRFGRKRIGLQLGKRIEWVRAAIKGSRMRRQRPATSAGGCLAAVSCSALRIPLQCQGGVCRVLTYILVEAYVGVCLGIVVHMEVHSSEV